MPWWTHWDWIAGGVVVIVAAAIWMNDTTKRLDRIEDALQKMRDQSRGDN